MFGRVLPATEGDYHKQQRRLVHPAFATRGVRELVHVFRPILQEVQCGIFNFHFVYSYLYKYQCCSALSDVLHSGVEDVDMFKWMSCVSLECVTQGLTGATYHSFEPGTYVTNKYILAMKQLVYVSSFC